jgi:hypothetical protein
MRRLGWSLCGLGYPLHNLPLAKDQLIVLLCLSDRFNNTYHLFIALSNNHLG